MQQGRKPGGGRGFRLAAIGVLVAVGAIAILKWREATPPPQSNAAVAAPAGAARASQLYFVDPQTGLPREPTAEEMARLTAARTAAPAEPIAIVGRDGTPGVILPEDAETAIVGTRNADGTISFSHVTGTKEAEARVKSAPGMSIDREEVPGDR